MAKYEYQCLKCETITEVERSIGHDEKRPKCCRKNMVRIYSATPAIFKGKGWGGQ